MFDIIKEKGERSGTVMLGRGIWQKKDITELE